MRDPIVKREIGIPLIVKREIGIPLIVKREIGIPLIGLTLPHFVNVP
jgi:hypothetical protein